MIQIRNLSALKYLDGEVGIDHTDHLSVRGVITYLAHGIVDRVARYLFSLNRLLW